MTQQNGPYPQSPTNPQIINLGLGQPSPALLPLEAIERAASERLGAGQDPLVLQYGARQGAATFRAALAAFLSEGYGLSVAAEQLAVTGGTSLGLSLAAQVFTRPGTTVACGDPTYFLARGILEDQHVKLLGIEVDEQGLDVDALERALEGGQALDAVYCIPSFHNPLGVSLAPARARKLVELAERHDFLVIADEPYTLLHFGPKPPPCMMAYDEGRGRVLSLGSFSKILGPGLRLGWAHAHPEVIERFLGHGTFRSGGGLNPVVASIVEGSIESVFLHQHVQQLRHTLSRRAEALATRLRQRLPEAAFTAPSGGYFIWCQLPDDRDAGALLEQARAHFGVAFTPGARCAVSRNLDACLRLSFAFYDEDELDEGVSRLARALRAGGSTGPS